MEVIPEMEGELNCWDSSENMKRWVKFIKGRSKSVISILREYVSRVILPCAALPGGPELEGFN